MPSTLPLALNILVVADNAQSLTSICMLVRVCGHKASSATNGIVALDHLKFVAFDLVFVELQRSDPDSLLLTRRLRLLPNSEKMGVIVIAPSNSDDHFIEAMHSGANDCLPGPLNPALFKAKLKYFADKHNQHLHLARAAWYHRNIMDHIDDPVLTLDVNGQVDAMNSMAHTLFDPRPVANRARPWRGEHCAKLLGLSLVELLTHRECRVRRADASLLNVAVKWKKWLNKGSTRYTIILHDQTERHAMDLLQNEFLATVSHEVRTPLTSVLGSLSLLAGGAAGHLPDAALELARVAQRNGKRLSRLIDDILDFSKIRSDQFVLDQQLQTIGPLLQEALEACQAYASSLGVKVQAEGIEAYGDTELELDADRFLQVMANLLSNAIKHSPHGSTVRLNLEMTLSSLRISVIDCGPGIDRAFHSQLFKLFAKAKAEGTAANGLVGTGMGLYISRTLIERMGGEIFANPISTQSSVGATFSVVFPLGLLT
jgi:signal transduction histidine kinase/FixJ family two-component response regulator